MPKLIAIDRRLIGPSFRGSVGTARDFDADHLFQCDAHTPLINFIDFVQTHAISGRQNSLQIWCHGGSHNGQLGYGLVFCRENLIHSNYGAGNLGQLGSLMGRISMTVLNACGAAHISNRAAAAAADPRHTDDDFGNGHLFCSTMARTLGSWLEASTESQLFRIDDLPRIFSSNCYGSGSLNYRAREGRWVVYNAGGNIISAATIAHPSADRSTVTRGPGGAPPPPLVETCDTGWMTPPSA